MVGTEGETAYVPLKVSDIIIIIINSIACPFTILLNVLVIKAVKTTPRLRSNCNVLLACLAVTDALTGLLGHIPFIFWLVFLRYGLSYTSTVENVFFSSLAVLITASCLHLMLVTFERLMAIKFTMQYSNFITDAKLKRGVTTVWVISFMCGIFSVFRMKFVLLLMGGLVTLSCIIFVASSYVILFLETRHHQKKIKAQQLPQEEVRRFSKENKALKTTVFIVGAVIVCLLPVCFCLIVVVIRIYDTCPVNEPFMQTCCMLNSLVNPLIYCWRQKGMRNVIFKIRPRVVDPALQ